MFRSLYFKIVLILVIFIVTVMCVVASVLLFSVLSYYSDDFTGQMEDVFGADSSLVAELSGSIADGGALYEQKQILDSYSRSLGIDAYRNYYILDKNGSMLSGSDTELGRTLAVTPNILSAITGENKNRQVLGADYADYAYGIPNADGAVDYVIYIKDSLDEVQNLSWILFSIIIQSLFLGLVIAIILAFSLARAITSPIRNITEGAQLIASGDFDYRLDVHNLDEIGILTDTFNDMKDRLKVTLDQVDGERRKLSAVFSYMRDAVIAFSDDGSVLQSNSSAAALFGKASGSVRELPKSFNASVMFKSFGISVEGDTLVSHSASGSERDGESYIFRDIIYDDKVFDVSIGAFPISRKNMTFPGVIAVIHDVTNRYELDKSRREFVANVSHELRTPLTVIKGACETVLDDAEITLEDRDHWLSMATDECDRMKRIVEDLLVLSRLENQRMQWQLTQFSVTELIRHICEALGVQANEHHHRLTFRSGKNIPLVTADRGRVEQVIVNIVSNSIKYTPDNGVITVTASYDGSMIRVDVKDNGVGIPEADLPHVFERFYRVEKARTSNTGGTGLGLAIAKEIINAHGGDIRIKSVYGKGSTVSILLPPDGMRAVDKAGGVTS